MRTYGTKSIFSAVCDMCLMGDIQTNTNFLLFNNTHLSICIIRILTQTLFELLLFHYEKSFTFVFEIFFRYNKAKEL